MSGFGVPSLVLVLELALLLIVTAGADVVTTPSLDSIETSTLPLSLLFVTVVAAPLGSKLVTVAVAVTVDGNCDEVS